MQGRAPAMTPAEQMEADVLACGIAIRALLVHSPEARAFIAGRLSKAEDLLLAFNLTDAQAARLVAMLRTLAGDEADPGSDGPPTT